MDVTYTDRAKQWGEGFSLLQAATTRLEEILGPSADHVKVVWDRTEDEKQRLLYRLSLSEGPDAATAVFDPDDLQMGSHVRYRLHRVLADLLQARNLRGLEAIQKT
jgi:hypothetical protein